MIVYVVERGEYDEGQVDSVWSSRAEAEARVVVCERDAWVLAFVLDRVPGGLGEAA